MTVAATEEILEVTEPGLYRGLDEATYHGDPVPERLGRSLSQSGAKTLLKVPALFKYERDHGRPSKPQFDLGHAAHREVLGVGAELAVVEADDWRTKAAQEAKAAAYAEGKTPLLRSAYDEVQAMAKAIREHPIASLLFNPERGEAEVSGFWQDGPTGVFRRFRLDWLPNPGASGRLILPDYKTSTTAERKAFGRKAADFGYFMQDPWYVDGAAALGLADVEEIAFLFVVQEKTAPYLVNVIELDEEAKRIGRQTNRRAVDLYAECQGTDTWPAYSHDVEIASLPGYFIKTHDEEHVS